MFLIKKELFDNISLNNNQNDINIIYLMMFRYCFDTCDKSKIKQIKQNLNIINLYDLYITKNLTFNEKRIIKNLILKYFKETLISLDNTEVDDYKFGLWLENK